jgi:hypothetical protein
VGLRKIIEKFVGIDGVRERSILLQEITLSQTDVCLKIEARRDDEGVFGIITISNCGFIVIVLTHSNFRALVSEMSNIKNRYYNDLRGGGAAEELGEVIGNKRGFACVEGLVKIITRTLFNSGHLLSKISLRENRRFLTIEARKGDAGVFGIVTYSAGDVSAYVLSPPNFLLLVEGLSKLKNDL